MNLLTKYRVVICLIFLMRIDWCAGYYWCLYPDPNISKHIFWLWNYVMQTSVWLFAYLLIRWYVDVPYKKALTVFMVGWLWFCGFAILKEITGNDCYTLQCMDPWDTIYMVAGTLLLLVQIIIPFKLKNDA